MIQPPSPSLRSRSERASAPVWVWVSTWACAVSNATCARPRNTLVCTSGTRVAKMARTSFRPATLTSIKTSASDGAMLSGWGACVDSVRTAPPLGFPTRVARAERAKRASRQDLLLHFIDAGQDAGEFVFRQRRQIELEQLPQFGLLVGWRRVQGGHVLRHFDFGFQVGQAEIRAPGDGYLRLDAQPAPDQLPHPPLEILHASGEVNQGGIERLESQLQRHAGFLAVAAGQIHDERRLPDQSLDLRDHVQIDTGGAFGRGDELGTFWEGLQQIVRADGLRHRAQIKRVAVGWD